MSALDQAEDSETDASVNYLQARFRIEPHSDMDCRIIATGKSGESVNQCFVMRDGGASCQCRAEVTGTDGRRRYLNGDISTGCICPIFAEHDCISTIESVESGEFIVSISVRDRDELVSIVSAIREIGAIPRLLQIAGSDVHSTDRLIELEADSITDKQLEAVHIAVELGYYDTPRDATLGDLAERLGISRSAVSQRLTAVESKLIVRLFEVDGGPHQSR